MIFALLIAATPWSIADEAELAPVREVFGFSEGLRPLDLEGDFVPAEECGACHRKAYEEWRSSRHSVSATNAIFLAGFTREPNIRCVRCHVPIQAEARPFLRYLRERRHRDASLDPKSEGIGCAACHLRGGVVLTSRPIETKEHATRFEPLLSDARFCAGCHQFRFERSHGAGAELTEHVTQDTWREWRSSGASDCRGCHMESAGHRFPGAHDLELLRSGISVSVHPGAIEIRASAGHRVPTGDLFRHLTVEVETASGWIEVARIGRRFEVDQTDGVHLKKLVEDTTLAPNESRHVSIPELGCVPASGSRRRTHGEALSQGASPSPPARAELGPAGRRTRGQKDGESAGPGWPKATEERASSGGRRRDPRPRLNRASGSVRECRWRVVYHYTREDAGVVVTEGPTIAPRRARSLSALPLPRSTDLRTSAR